MSSFTNNLLTPFCFRWCYWLGRVVLSIQKKQQKINKKSTTHYKLKITKNNTVHDIFYYRICVFVYVLTPSNNNNNNSVIPLVEFSCLIPKKLDLYLFIYCHIFVIFDKVIKLRGFKGNLIEVSFGNFFSFLCRT